MERERLGSRLGFILLSAGCAIGIGNVWKFPYVAGQNGGAIFIGIYLLFLVLLGIPVLCMEFSLGRASQKSCARLYETLTPQKKLALARQSRPRRQLFAHDVLHDRRRMDAQILFRHRKRRV